LKRARVGWNDTPAISASGSSTLRLLAASISRTSRSSPGRSADAQSHSPHGSVVGSFAARQFSARAKMRAIDVFPTPRGPQNM